MNSQTTFSKAIIGKVVTFSLALCLTGSAAFFTDEAYAANLNLHAAATDDSASNYSAADLDNLLAPVALYPDSLLAQVLVAATFDDQIQDASQLLSAGRRSPSTISLGTTASKPSLTILKSCFRWLPSRTGPVRWDKPTSRNPPT